MGCGSSLNLSSHLSFTAYRILNVFPLAIALSVDGDLTKYNTGFFNIIAGIIAGDWLMIAFNAAAILSLIGLFR